MGTKHHSSSDPTADSKRRRLSRKDEVLSPDSFQVEPIDLYQFFEEDGKIYGYQGLKITVWLSSISFHAYADISFESSSDGGKGITDLKSSLQNIFAENLVESKDDFLQTFSTECHYVKSLVAGAEVLSKDALTDSSGNSICHFKEESINIERNLLIGTPKCAAWFCLRKVLYKNEYMFYQSSGLIFCIRGPEMGQLYSRLVPLVLLLVDGSNPIDVTDPKWEIYILIRKDHHDSCTRLLAFAAVYRFHRYPDGIRLRLGQILTIPPYQRNGCGGCLLQLLNNIAISDDVYDLTIEEPVESLQHVRTCINVRRLLAYDPVLRALDPIVSKLKHENLSKKSQPFRCGPPASIIKDVRKKMKINKRQFIMCWEILIYLSLDPVEKYMENYVTIISGHVRADVIGKESEGAGKRLVDIPTQFDKDMSFAMFKSRDGDCIGAVEKDESEGNQEEQLKQLVEERMREIKSIGEKVAGRVLL
ncbi:histone acetyltransferase type B catalytic subunit [Striga asiatica]|uniref:histone acetyltransferase n=1 Tax=Striga asiatica TaxID=4170 RepID=A0A5A7R1X6_STRAF|nr:histone acetyltransferase type B catalytic subunit [Striga asiatica]